MKIIRQLHWRPPAQPTFRGKVDMSQKPDAEAFLELGSAHVCDALRSCGRAFQAIDAGIRPVAPSMRVAGPAFTVRCYPGATWALEQALELAPLFTLPMLHGRGFYCASGPCTRNVAM